MIILKEHQVCPEKARCPHADGCYGTNKERSNKFTCEFIDDDGNINEGGVRIPQDKTGKMKVIMEGNIGHRS